jgi:hypothetical protein
MGILRTRSASYKIELWAGPFDGEVVVHDYLPEDINRLHEGEYVRYVRIHDGKANPWRYSYMPGVTDFFVEGPLGSN